MKNKKIIILLLTIMLLTSGCTKRYVDKETKKSYVSNILCKPAAKETIDAYTKNAQEMNLDISTLSDCKSLKINANGYEGLWTSFFVKPLAWLIVKIGNKLNSYGLSIILLGVLLRVILLPTSIKAAKMSENMNKAQKELNALEKKYANKTEKEAMLAKSQEMMLIYKKYNINPISSCLTSFIQIPLLFAFLEAIYRVPIIFEGKLAWFDLGKTPWESIAIGKYYYIILVVLISLTTYLSFQSLNNQTKDSPQAKQMNAMKIYMVVFITFVSFSLPTAIAMYWIASSGFSVVQTYITKRLSNSNK